MKTRFLFMLSMFCLLIASTVSGNYIHQEPIGNLVASWDFNNLSIVLLDHSGNENHGFVDGPTIESSPNGNAYVFDGVNDIIEIDTSESFRTLSSDFTIEAVLQLTSYGSQKGGCFLMFYGSISENILCFFVTSTLHEHKVIIDTGAGGSPNNYAIFDYIPPLNQWFVITLGASGGYYYLYINGTYIQNHIWNSPLNTPVLDKVYIGTDRDSSSLTDFFPGKIDELRIYNRNLTSTEIQEHYFSYLINPGLPLITRPPDFDYSYNSLGNSITWTLEDDNPDNYTIYRDGMVIGMGDWDNGETIFLNIDYLSIGIHNYTIVARDLDFNYVYDSVIVTVLGVTSESSFLYVLSVSGTLIVLVILRNKKHKSKNKMY